MTRVLYIAGYGRSGSTVLGTILGAHPELIHVGEVSHLFDYWAGAGHECSCGTSYAGCEFWSSLSPQIRARSELAAVVRNCERLRSLPALLLRLTSSRQSELYGACQSRLLEYATRRSGTSVVVDSSKSAWWTVGRFLALRWLADQDVYVLHLVRDGLGTMESQVVSGDNRALEGLVRQPRWLGLRTVVGWIGANVLVQRLARLMDPSRYLLVRYEDLVADPSGTLDSIGDFCGFDAAVLADRLRRSEYFPVGHVVGGNRVRFQGKIRLETETGMRSPTRLSGFQQRLFRWLGGWLQRSYGYS